MNKYFHSNNLINLSIENLNNKKILELNLREFI